MNATMTMTIEDIREEIETICRKFKYGLVRRTDVRARYEMRLAELRKRLEEMRKSD